MFKPISIDGKEICNNYAAFHNWSHLVRGICKLRDIGDETNPLPATDSNASFILIQNVSSLNRFASLIFNVKLWNVKLIAAHSVNRKSSKWLMLSWNCPSYKYMRPFFHTSWQHISRQTKVKFYFFSLKPNSFFNFSSVNILNQYAGKAVQQEKTAGPLFYIAFL